MSGTTPVSPSRLVAALAHNPNVRKGHAGDDAVQLYLTNQGIGHTVLQHLRALGYEAVSINPRFGMVRCVPVDNSVVAPKHNGDAVEHHRGRLVTDGGTSSKAVEPMYCPGCDEMVPDEWDPIDERWRCPRCSSTLYEDKEEYIETVHATARFNKEHGYGHWWDGDDELATDGGARYSDPLTEQGASVGRGAVLYDTREAHARPCCARPEGRCLAHVIGVYEETTTGEVYYKVADGTWTTEEWIHADDLLAIFEPAGWCVTGVKPTYLLTREHGVEDHHDLMTDGGQDGGERVLACPDCDSADWAPVTGRNGDRDDLPDADYYCRACGARFDELVERECHSPTSTAPTNGLAAALWAAEDDDLATDGGQVELTRNPTVRELVEPVFDDDRHPTCPDCGQRVSPSKGGHDLLDDAPAGTTHGWTCDDCNNVLPCNCQGRNAPAYNERFAGIEATFREGHSRYIPVPARQVDDDTAAAGEGER